MVVIILQVFARATHDFVRFQNKTDEEGGRGQESPSESELSSIKATSIKDETSKDVILWNGKNTSHERLPKLILGDFPPTDQDCHAADHESSPQLGFHSR